MTHTLRLFVPALLFIYAAPVMYSYAGEITGSAILLAQNTPVQQEASADSAAAEPVDELPSMPPMPPAKTHISTEKPVPDLPLRTIPGTPAPVADSTPAESGTPAAEDAVPAEARLPESVPAADEPAAYNPNEASGPAAESAVQGVVDAAEAAAGALAGAAAAQSNEIAGQVAAETGRIVTPQQQDAVTEPEPDAAGQEVAVLPPQSRQTAIPPQMSPVVRDEISLFNVPTGNLRTMKVVIDDDYNLRGLVYGEEQGYLRKLEADSAGNFREVWKSPPLNSQVREVFVEDIDGNGGSEIVAYTNNGNMFIFSYDTTEMIYRTPEGTYENIRCMLIANMDDDPQKELFFIASRGGALQQGNEAGNLIQFDTVSQFDEWTSSDLYTATDMVIGNVDNDDEMEIVLNTGEILSFRFKTVKWESDIDFGSRLYLIDMDNDGILELLTEYNQSYVRIFDIDQRQEKW